MNPPRLILFAMFRSVSGVPAAVNFCAFACMDAWREKAKTEAAKPWSYGGIATTAFTTSAIGTIYAGETT